MLAGTLTMPERALGIVLFAHQGFYADGMVEHDGHVGQLLKKLGDLGIADNTIVIYSTDNGPHYNAWPDAAVTPLPRREEHELGGRLQCAVLHPLDRQDSRRRDLQRHRLG